MAKELSKKQLREWMNIYHDLYVEAHNRLLEAGIASTDKALDTPGT